MYPSLLLFQLYKMILRRSDVVALVCEDDESKNNFMCYAAILK